MWVEGSGGNVKIGKYPVVLPSWRDPRLALSATTGTLNVVGQIWLEFPISIGQILISWLTCAVIEMTISFRREKAFVWPTSALLTASGLTLILRVPGTEYGDWWSMNAWWLFVGASAFGMATKYLIRPNGRHVFNPSNIAIVVAFVLFGPELADPQYLWWGPIGFGLILAWAIIVNGIFIVTRRAKQMHTFAGFMVTWGILVAIIAATGHSISAAWHVGPIEGTFYWTTLVMSPETWVFSLFMITDPRTSPNGRIAQIIYGSSCATIAAFIASMQTDEFGTKVGLLASLVLVCPFVRHLEAWWPRRDISVDSVRAWISGASPTMPRRPKNIGARFSLAILPLALVGISVASMANSHTMDTESPASHSEIDVSLRSSVPFDATNLPRVQLGASLSSVAIDISEERAQVIGADVAHSLAIEREALRTSDRELAAVSTYGIRHTQVMDAMGQAANLSSIVTAEYDWLEMTVELVKISEGTQSPPDLALHARAIQHEIIEPEGTRYEPREIEITFIVHEIDGVHLVANAMDSNGVLIGDQTGGRAPFPDALEIPPLLANEEQLEGLQFVEVTAEVGLDVPHSSEEFRDGAAVQTGGASVADYDGDGDLDIFVGRMGLPNMLFRNDGGKFVDVAVEVGVDGGANQSSTGSLWFDVDGDGDKDLLVLGFGDTPNRLYLQTDGLFEDVTEEWGIPNIPRPNEYATFYSAATADIDGDGYLDLLIADSEPLRSTTSSNLALTPSGQPCSVETQEVYRSQPAASSRTRLLRNTRSGFEDISDQLGTDMSMVVTFVPRFVDINGDGADDLFIAGDYCTSRVLLNDGSGNFTDITQESGAGMDENGMGIEILDMNDDGILDIFVTSISYPTEDGVCPLQDVALGCTGNRVYLSNGDGTFEDGTDEFGVRDGYWGWGTASADFNLNGRIDLMMTNGYRTIMSEGEDDGSFYDRPLYERSRDDPDLLWLNVGAGPWPQVAQQVGLDSTGSGKAAIAFDFDGDGKRDLLVIENSETPRLYKNVTENDNSWLKVVLSNPESPNTHGVGAIVTLYRDDDLPPVPRRVGPDGSFQSGRPTRAHFGVGEFDVVDRVEVRWPDGHVQVVEDVPANQELTVIYNAQHG